MRRRSMLAAAWMASVFRARPAFAQEEAQLAPISVGSEITMTSRYIWRGFDGGGGFRVQPNVWVALGGLQLSLWMDVGPGDADGTQLTEQDVTLEYGRNFDHYEVRSRSRWVPWRSPLASASDTTTSSGPNGPVSAMRTSACARAGG